MEKKQYINPEIEVIKVQTMQMLAASEKSAYNEEPDEYGSHFLEGDDW